MLWVLFSIALAQDCDIVSNDRSPIDQSAGPDRSAAAWNLLPVDGEMLLLHTHGARLHRGSMRDPIEVVSIEQVGDLRGALLEAWTIRGIEPGSPAVLQTSSRTVDLSVRAVESGPPPTVTLDAISTDVVLASRCRRTYADVEFSLGPVDEGAEVVVELQAAEDVRFGGEVTSWFLEDDGAMSRREGERFVRARAWSPGHRPGRWSNVLELRRGCASAPGGASGALMGLLLLLARRQP